MTIQIKHLLPEDFCRGEDFTSGVIGSVVTTTDSCIGEGLTGPGQRALE